MPTFWFSRKNLVRMISHIMDLFNATDSDMDSFERIINAHESRIRELEQSVAALTETVGNCLPIFYRDELLDSASELILDSSGNPIRTRMTVRSISAGSDGALYFSDNPDYDRS